MLRLVGGMRPAPPVPLACPLAVCCRPPQVCPRPFSNNIPTHLNCFWPIADFELFCLSACTRPLLPAERACASNPVTPLASPNLTTLVASWLSHQPFNFNTEYAASELFLAGLRQSWRGGQRSAAADAEPQSAGSVSCCRSHRSSPLRSDTRRGRAPKPHCLTREAT